MIKHNLIQEYARLKKECEERGVNSFRAKRMKEIEEMLNMSGEEIMKGMHSISDVLDIQTC